MKKIYLVRHGETGANLERYVPSKLEPLNDNGRLQAEKLAERLSNLDIDKVIISDFPRTKETITPYLIKTGKDYEINPAFGEVTEPSSLFNTSEEDERILEYRRLRNSNVENPDWRMEDGENFSDIFGRVKQAREYLENCEAENVVVTSHSFFIRLLGAHIITENETATNNWFNTSQKFKVSNTGISLLTFDAGVWKIITWNDHAHFAE